MSNVKFILILVWICFGSIFSFAQKYALVNLDNPLLLVNANAIIREDIIQGEFVSNNSILVRKKYAVTILNDKGKNLAMVPMAYDKQLKLSKYEAVLFDQDGKKIRNVKNNEILDVAASDGISLMEDNRYKVATFNYAIYPYTVAYDIEYEVLTGFYPLKSYLPTQPNVSCEYFEASYKVPLGILFEHRAFDMDLIPKVDTLGNHTSVKYVVKNKLAIQKENDLNPYVIFKQTKFLFDEYKGSSESWKDYGNFIYNLSVERDELPESTTSMIKAKTAHLTDVKQKVDTLYKFLQEKTRYISIQLGIGGFQPFKAADVDKLGYGDCKALSNYMQAMLKTAGIKSHYILIGAGSDALKMNEDFVTSYFNHAILCVPNDNDTIWLECTSRDWPTGYLSDFTSNRKCLLVEKDNSRVVQTPYYNEKQNLTSRSAKASILDDGSVSVEIKAQYENEQSDDIIGVKNNYSEEEFKKYINSLYTIKSFEIKKFKHQYIKKRNPILYEELSMHLPFYCSKSGNRLFVVPAFLTKIEEKMTVDSTTTKPMVLHKAYTITDTLVFDIPKGYKIETLPKPKLLVNTYNEYEYKISQVNDQIYFVRRWVRRKGSLDRTKQAERAALINEAFTIDRSKMVFVKI